MVFRLYSGADVWELPVPHIHYLVLRCVSFKHNIYVFLLNVPIWVSPQIHPIIPFTSSRFLRQLKQIQVLWTNGETEHRAQGRGLPSGHGVPRQGRNWADQV